MKFLRYKTGPLLGFIGGLVLAIFLLIAIPNFIFTSIIELRISMFLLLLWGVLAIVGFRITLKENKIGYYLLFVAGVGSLVELFIFPMLLIIFPIPIVVPLLLIGGILSLITIKEDT